MGIRLTFIMFAFAAGLVTCLGAHDAEAFQFFRFKKGAPKKRHFELELGGRAISHYSGQDVISTPPSNKFAEAKLTFFSEDIAALYAQYSRSVDLPLTQVYGLGVKVPAIWTQTTLYARISLCVDFNMYNTADPEPPKVHQTSSIFIRYGISLDLGVQELPFFINATGMAGFLQNNFFIAPYAGIGFSL